MSTDSPDALDLDALRELCNQHLAGQWANDGSELYRGECAEYNLGWVAETCDIALPDNGDSTGSFIVAAVNAVPALIAEVERLRAQWRNGLCGGEDVLRYERDGARAEVERLTQQRDSAREWAVRLEQQNAEAQRLAQHAIDEDYRNSGIYACEEIVRILGAFPDDETEEQ